MTYTIKQLQKKDSPEYVSDKLLLTTLINERVNKLSNPYSPLSSRLNDLLKKVENGSVFHQETEGMKTFFIEVSGKDEGDIVCAIEECKRVIENGNRSGFDSNEDGNFSFESIGDYTEEENED